MGGRHALLAVAVLAALLAAAPVLAAAASTGGLTFTVETQTFKASVGMPVFNESVSIPANGTYTINVSLPKGWTEKDVAAVYVVAYNASGRIQLSAKDANGTVIASGTIVPLSSGYTQTLPPNTSVIELSASEAANATIVVYVDSQPVSFTLSFDKSELHVEMGNDAWLHGTLKQLEGPAGYVFFTWDIPDPLSGGVYWSQSTADPADVNSAIQTSGAGWSHDVYLHVDASKVSQEDNFNVVVHAYYSPTDPSSGHQMEQMVATVTLASVYAFSTTTSSAGHANGQAVRYALYGFGAVVFLGLLLLFARRL